jgi:hypothetical protein
LGASIFQKRIEEYANKGARHFYFMSLKATEHIDASKKGNVSRFINHSCDPNCVLQKWVVGNQMRVGLFAKREIPAWDELTFDYKFERYGSKAQVCYCGASNCTGYIGKEKSGPILNLEELDGLSEEEDEESESNQFQQKVVTGKPLTTIDHVKDLVKYLMLHSSSTNKILKALNRILKTDSTSLLRKFVHYRGIYMLHRCLTLHLDGKEILRYNLLLALKSLPISTKNPVIEIEKLLEELDNVNEYGEKTAQLAKDILENWKDLEIVYKIPKRLNTSVGEDDSEDREQKRPKAERKEIMQENSYITHQIEDDETLSKPALAWNSISRPIMERTESVVSVAISSVTVDAMSESSIQEMVRAAQMATTQANESAKKKQQQEEERKRKLMEMKKKKLKAQKEKLKEMQIKAMEEKNREKRKESTGEQSQKEPKREKIDMVLSVEQRSTLKNQVYPFHLAFSNSDFYPFST